jgi:type I restriction enzyme S subunit
LGELYAGLNGKSGADFSKEYVEGFSPFVPFVSIANFERVPREYQFVRVNSNESQNLIKQGDILFLMSSETFEDIAKAAVYDQDDEDVFLNSFCKGFRPNSNRLNSSYANYLLMANCYRHYFSSSARGFTRINLKQEYINNTPAVLPPVSEQLAIAKFLDNKCSNIDEAIRIEESQIALLRERKQIIIQEAVTRGLNHAVQTKESGIDWVGQIPMNWESIPNKYLFKLKKETVGKRSGQYDLLSLTLRGVIKRDMDNPEGKFPTDFDTYQEVSPGDFIFCHFDVEETPRTVGLSDYFGMITGAYTVYSVTPGVDPRFLLHFYIFADTDKKMRSMYTGLRNTISKDAFGAFKTPLPPIEEQRAIVAHIDDASRKIEDSIEIKERQIAALNEYRASLIDAAVTGKIKIT